MLAPTGAQALPYVGDASVVSGQVDFSAVGNSLTANQGSTNAIINWNAFSLGANESLSFLQSASAATTLLRFTGSGPINIGGNLTSLGSLFIVAPGGIVLDGSLTVSGAALWLSTTDISDANFLAGIYDFGGSGGGTITIGGGGSINLIGGGSGSDYSAIALLPKQTRPGINYDFTYIIVDPPTPIDVGLITLIPEPETYGLVLAGLALLFATARRRKGSNRGHDFVSDL